MMNITGAVTFPDWLSPFILSIGPVKLSWYGLAYVVGVAIAYYYATRLVKNNKYWVANGVPKGTLTRPTDKMLEDFAFYCMLGIMIGGRLGSVILYNPEQYLADPMKVFRVWEGGMAFHGGLLGLITAIFYVTRRHKISIWRWSDMAAVGAPVGLGLGRLANFVNQELWGRPTDVPWAFIFPRKDFTPRHPSQFYEAFLEGLVLFLILRVMVTRFKALTYPGLCGGAFLMFYGIFRFTVEFFREPDPIPQIHEYFTRGMAYSLPMILIGFLIMLRSRKHGPLAPATQAPVET